MLSFLLLVAAVVVFFVNAFIKSNLNSLGFGLVTAAFAANAYPGP